MPAESAAAQAATPFRSRLLAFSLGFLIIMLAVQPAFSATIQTDLWIYQQGDTVTVTGADYGSGETVEIVTTDPNGVEVDRGAASADELGGFTYQFVLMSDVPGIYDVVGTGVSSGLAASTQFDPPPTSPPLNLRFIDSRASGGSVVLTWTAGSSNTECYLIYRSLTSMAAFVEDAGDVVANGCDASVHTGRHGAAFASVPSTSTTFSDTSTGATNFYYRVTGLRDGNNQGESASTNQVGTMSLNTSPASHSFGSVATGSSSAAQVFTVTNNSNASYQFESVTRAGGNAADFAVSGVPAAGTSVAAGSNLTFSVTFTPGAAGARSTTLQINSRVNSGSSAVLNTRTAPVSGTGVADGSAPVGSITINNGDAATNTTAATLRLQATDATGVTAYRVANGSDCTSAAFVAVPSITSLDTAIAHTLTSGDAVKTVCAQFRDAAGNISTPAVTDTILLDTGVPSVSIALNPAAPTGANGWYVSNVTVTVAANDGGSGVNSSTIEYSLNGGSAWLPYAGPFVISSDGNHTVDARAKDNASNTATATQATSKLDKTVPHDVNGTPDRAPNANGWYNASVDVDFDGVDDLSGIDFCSFTTYSGPDDGAASVPGSCTDKAGNVGNGSFGLKYDETDPTVEISFAPASPDGDNGWYVSDVEVTLTSSDNLSGVDLVQYSLDGGTTWATYTAAFTVHDDGEYTVDAKVVDEAGNQGTDTADLDIDQTDPEITLFTRVPLENLNDWNNTDVTLTWACTDDTSGVANAFVSNVATAEGEDYDSTQTCEDNAGNTASATEQVSIDKTVPHDVNGTPDRAPNANGWYNASVDVDFDGVDDLSGIDFCSFTTYSGPDDGAASVPGSCTDKAGNVGNGSFGLKYDETDPTVEISFAPASPDGDNGWYVSDVEVTLTSSDNLSGVDLVQYSLDGGTTWATYTAAFTVHDDGEYTVDAKVVDEAGNQGTDTADLDIDQTDPTVAISFAPVGPDGDNGWYVSDVEVTLTSNDNLSGVDLVQYSLDGGATWNPYTAAFTIHDDGEYTVDARVFDEAGNQGTDTADLAIDQTDPTITFSSRMPAANADGWNNTDVHVTWTCFDATSGPFEAAVFDTVTDEGAGQFAIASCEDNAGNGSETDSVGGISIDKTAPAITNEGPTTSPNAAGWYNHDVTNVFKAADSLSGLNAACLAAFPDAGDKQSKTTSAEGTMVHVTSDSCTDVADNMTAAINSANFKIDKTAPAITNEGPTTSPNAAGWYNHDVTNVFKAADSLSGLNAACLAAFPDAGDKQSKTTSAEGTMVHVTSDSCTDVADNMTAAINSANFKIDKTAPAVDLTSPADGSSTIALTIAVSGTSSDSLSGLSYVKVNGLPATVAAGSFSAAGVPLSCGSNTISAMAADVAGNSAGDTIHVTRICFGNVQYYQPLDQSTSSMAHPVTNSGKMGRVIPTKVTFKSDDGIAVTDTVAAARGWTILIGVNGASCDNGAATDSVEAYADAGMSNAGTNLFRWTSGQWMYNLDTGKPPQVTMAINKCYRLDVYVDDGMNKVKVSTATYAIFKPTK